MKKILLTLLALTAVAFSQTKTVSPTGAGLTELTNPTFRTALGGTTVGQNLFTLTNPGAITFPRFNADNTVSSLSASDFRTAIGSTTVGSNIITLSNPSAISFLRINADNTITALSSSNYVAALGGTTVGSSFFTLTNPGAITFPRINADNTVSPLSAANFTTALGGTVVGANFLTLANPGAITFPRINADNTITALSSSNYVTALGGTTLGANLFTITGPGAITFPRFNADNTVSSLSAADFRTAIGAGTGGTTLTNSASLASALSDETGSNLAVFGTSPTLTTPVINVTSDATGDIYYRNAGGLFTRLPIGSTNDVLKVTAGLPSWGAAASAGLTNFTEAVNTSSPNGTVPIVSLTAANAATDVDFAIVPKGAGAIVRLIATGSSSTGNKRGIGAVEFQSETNSAARVASGQYSAILSGRYNQSSGVYTVIGGGTANVATATGAVIAGGDTNTASGTYAFIGGGGVNTASGTHSTIPGGSNNTAAGAYSFITGSRALDRGIYGSFVYASGQQTQPGDAQHALNVLRCRTTNTTPKELTTDNSAGSSTNRIILPDDTVYAFHGQAIARGHLGSYKAWTFSGAIKRGANAAATAALGSITVTVIGEDAGATSWTLSIDANTTAGALRLNATGTGTDFINWVASVETLQGG